MSHERPPYAPHAEDAVRPVRASWHRFLDDFEPLRPELYRYCRHLTRSPWDAEDLAQDALARAFATLATMFEGPPNPRAWLFRVASNLWIDRRRRAREDHLPIEAAVDAPDPVAAREAAGTLLGQLGPQERAAVVLKDVFDFSIEEIATMLSTTTGAVKAALHRGRGKLVESPAETARVPAPGVIDEFCSLFNAGDIDGVTKLLLESSTVEVVSATTVYGPEAARKTVLPGMRFGMKIPTRLEPRFHRGEWILIQWYTHDDGEFVRGVTRIQLDTAASSAVSHIRLYFFTPEFIADVCGELAVPFRTNGFEFFR